MKSNGANKPVELVPFIPDDSLLWVSEQKDDGYRAIKVAMDKDRNLSLAVLNDGTTIGVTKPLVEDGSRDESLLWKMDPYSAV